MTAELKEALTGGRRGGARPELSLEEKLHPLLQALLAQLRRSRETPLQFGIDSEGIASVALKDCLAGVTDEPPGQWRDWQLVTVALDRLVARSLQQSLAAHPPAPFLPRLARNERGASRGEGQSNLARAESQPSGPPHPSPLLPPTEEREKLQPSCKDGADDRGREAAFSSGASTPHPLAVWLERFYTVVREVQPRAIDIVGRWPWAAS
jgi:hypothetical protein